MKSNYLFPNKFKLIGWLILLPSSIFGFLTLWYEFEPSFLNFRLPAFFIDEISFLGKKRFFGIIKNNFLNEIFGVLIIISALLVAFSREKNEDEYIAKIRLDSLVWAIYFNYAVLIFLFLFIYDFSFMWVMIFNMFNVLLFFIVRFNWKIYQLKKTNNYEE